MAKAAKRFVICVDNSGYEVSLERRKIYVSLPDPKAARLGQLRVIDESGEDYLYPKVLSWKSLCRSRYAGRSWAQPNPCLVRTATRPRLRSAHAPPYFALPPP